MASVNNASTTTFTASISEYGSCSTDSLIPNYVTYIFGGIYGITLIWVSIVAAIESDDVTFSNFGNSPKQVLKHWFKTIWKKKRCYLPMVTHIIDQVTDIGVICEFGLLSLKETENNYTDNNNSYSYDYCGGVNTFYLFIASLVSFWGYRIVTCFIIEKETNSILRLLLQLFDF